MFKTFENFESMDMAMILHIRRLAFALSVFVAMSGSAQKSGFVPNHGQWHENVSYQYLLSNGTFWVEDDGWTILFYNADQLSNAMHALHGEEGNTLVDGSVVKTEFVGANDIVEWSGIKTQSFYRNYFLSNQPSKWKTRVPGYEEIVGTSLYEGIDVVISTTNGYPKYTYVIHPHVKYNKLIVQYNGVNDLKISNKDLVISTRNGALYERGLEAYQLIDGNRIQVDCAFKIIENRVSFDVGTYDANHKLYIDPTIIASTNSGCTSEAFGHTATFNEVGQIYSAGRCFWFRLSNRHGLISGRFRRSIHRELLPEGRYVFVKIQRRWFRTALCDVPRW